MSNKAVTQMTDPEYTVEFDGKETYVMRNGVKLDRGRAHEASEVVFNSPWRTN